MARMCVLLAVSLFFLPLVAAQTELQPPRDAFIYEGEPLVMKDTGFLYVGNDEQGKASIALAKFDIRTSKPLERAILTITPVASRSSDTLLPIRVYALASGWETASWNEPPLFGASTPIYLLGRDQPLVIDLKSLLSYSPGLPYGIAVKAVENGDEYNLKEILLSLSIPDAFPDSEASSSAVVIEESISPTANVINAELHVATLKKTYAAGEVVRLTDPPLIQESHPALLYKQIGIAAIRDRIKRAPYSSWWSPIKGIADNALGMDAGSGERRSRANLAKILAFSYTITQQKAYADKARDFLFQMESGEDYVNYHAFADGLGWYGQAYDMLKGNGYDFGAYTMDERKWYCVWLCKQPVTYSYDSEIRDKIQKETYKFSRDDSMAWECTKDVVISLVTFSPKAGCISEVGELMLADNNIRIRRYSSVGMAALSILDKKDKNYDVLDTLDVFNLLYNNDAAKMFRDATEQVMDGITNQIVSNEEGGWGEGTYYLQYAARNYLPFLRARKNMGYEDDLSALAKVHEWAVKIRLPNGQRPNFDDAGFDFFMGGWLSDSAGKELHRWDWETSAAPYYAPPFDNFRVDSIVFFDDSALAKAPSFSPTQFLPEAGNAVFRSDWGREAIYLLLMGEHRRARTQGLSHEHPDATSFQMFAFDQPLALDSGYIKWEAHSSVNKPENHNLILVDGKGPPIWDHMGIVYPDVDVDTYLQNYFDTDMVDYGEVTARYEETDIERAVLFPDHRYFVISDSVSSARTHDYDWMLHGNNEGGSFTSTANGGIWEKGNAQLAAYILNPDSISTNEYTHSFSYDQQLTHTAISARKSGKDASFLAVLYPQKKGFRFPEMVSVDGKAVKITEGSRTDIVFSNRESEAVSPEKTTTGVASIATDAQLSFTSTDNGQLDYVTNIGGTFYKFEDGYVYASDSPIDVYLKARPDAWSGYIRGNGRYRLQLFVNGQIREVRFRNALAPFVYADGILTLNLEGEGSLELLGIEPPVLPKSQIRNYGERISGDVQVKIQRWDAGAWTDYQIVIDEPVEIAEDGFLALDTLFNAREVQIDQPGRYRIYAEFTDGDKVYHDFSNNEMKDQWEFMVIA